jgi:hypothetical protein
MPFYLLLAMQAAGMVTDYLGAKNQQKFGEMGLKIQQAGINANIYQTRLETEQASLQAMQDLRKNMGTQIAVMSARGTSTAAGSSVALMNESVSDFNADERMRKINQLSRENELKAGGTIAKLNQNANNSKLWSSFASRSLERFPTSAAGWGALGKSAKSSFGLTPVGG